MRPSALLVRYRHLALALLLAGTALAAAGLWPLQYDFSFTTLFVGDGPEYDRLRDYLRRFGTDVNMVVVAVEADDLWSAERMTRLDELAEQLARLEGVDDVIGPTNAEVLVGENGELRMERLVPEPFPETAAEWDAVRQRAVEHPLLGGAIYGVDGRHTALVVRFDIEGGPVGCNDGVDNDATGGVDCHDPGCWAVEGLCEPHGPEDENAACTNEADDDGDRLVDCADPDCDGLAACVWVGSPETGRDACRNGLDDDGDGLRDCADVDCARNADVPYCSTTLAVTEIISELDAEARADGWGAFYLGGVPYISEIYTGVIQHDLKVFLPLTGLVVALLLLALFRTLRGVLLPITVVGVGIVWAVGFMMGTGGKLNMINSSMPTLLLVIAIADSVHILTRYLDEAERSADGEQAARRTMRYMAPACLLTSVTSAVGFASLTTAHLPIIRGFGSYTAFGILLSYVVTMLLMPACLASLPLQTARQGGAELGLRVSRWLTDLCVSLVTRHAFATTLALLAFGVVMGWGISRIDRNMHIMEELQEDNEAAVANRVIEEHLGGVLSGAIVFHGSAGTFADPEALRAFDEIGAFAEDWRWEDGRPLIARAYSLAPVVREAHAAYRGADEFNVIPGTSAGVVALLDQLPVKERSRLVSADYGVAHISFRMYDVGSSAWSALRAELAREVAARSSSFGDAEWYFTGSSTLGQDAMRFMTRDLVTSLMLAVVIIMLLMSALFRSIRLGMLSMVPNAFPLLVTLGAVGYLGIEMRVSTAVVFSVSLGIAVDDTIHVLVRFREELDRGTAYAEALEQALHAAGRGVIFTTVILCIGFGALTFSEFTAVRELGRLGGITLVSALVGDLLVLPLVLLKVRPALRHALDGGQSEPDPKASNGPSGG